MSNHTQGPWHAFKVSDYWIIGESPPAPGRHIARASSMLGDETEANARLIAAAPELLEALIECHKALGEHVKKDKQRNADLTACMKAWAAITKAKGDSP